MYIHLRDDKLTSLFLATLDTGYLVLMPITRFFDPFL